MIIKSGVVLRPIVQYRIIICPSLTSKFSRKIRVQTFDPFRSAFLDYEFHPPVELRKVKSIPVAGNRRFNPFCTNLKNIVPMVAHN
ncbi:MAG: hypothetical protein LBF79_05035, partial [Dysgonamonadaceae bacterium]|nr:hypothetical protein [Dysgonamonadaceae bacterium]